MRKLTDKERSKVELKIQEQMKLAKRMNALGSAAGGVAW